MTHYGLRISEYRACKKFKKMTLFPFLPPAKILESP